MKMRALGIDLSGTGMSTESACLSTPWGQSLDQLGSIQSTVPVEIDQSGCSWCVTRMTTIKHGLLKVCTVVSVPITPSGSQIPRLKGFSIGLQAKCTSNASTGNNHFRWSYQISADCTNSWDRTIVTRNVWLKRFVSLVLTIKNKYHLPKGRSVSSGCDSFIHRRFFHGNHRFKHGNLIGNDIKMTFLW